MMTISSLVKKMVTKLMIKKNPLKGCLFTKKYKPRIIKPKKVKEVLKEKKND